MGKLYHHGILMGLLLLLVSGLSACVVSPVASAPTDAVPMAEPKLRLENVWSQPAILAPVTETTPCIDLATSAQSADPCEAPDLPICATDESPMAEMAMATVAENDSAARGVVYLTIYNDGDAADYLTAIETEMATTVELHQTTMDANGVMKMRPVTDKLAVPPAGALQFSPGNYHIMLVGLQQDLKIGDHFLVTLTFAESGPITIESEVRLPVD